ncbi:hypothetical protein EDD18DRAFT_1325746 [Armillaria luteobubalina]|uniref:Heterokaryon incompatibility domain-containing protein n=1 Tax=Armillaria luteobubalina TaxID=153913 RepID=A0AA39UWN4_9AGAR|nr:hypothetical protein EDD18DRAFT_1325746 [Armillaria luteobubalina]
MFLYYARSAWEYVKLKLKIAIYKWTCRKVLYKVLEDAKHKLDDNRGHTDRLEPSEVTISSQTETGQTEESIEVPKQRVYTGSKPVISSSLADIPCSCLGIQDLLDLFNSILGTSHTLETGSLSSVLKDCIAENYDFGTAYGRLRRTWDYGDIQKELSKREAEDINLRQQAVVGSRIVNTDVNPRRVWDLYSNRVVPWWCCEVNFMAFSRQAARPISHAWVNEVDRVDMWTPINGREWPVPIPKGANLNLIRIEMLNLGLEYTWLDVLCLRQRRGPKEDLRVEEWKLDVPTIGAIYRRADVVCYLSGLGLPLILKEGDLESDRCWFRRAWTVQEVGWERTIAGDTPDGPMHAEPMDDVGNYEDEILVKFHKQLNSVETADNLFGVLSAMQDRISTNPVDRVAGLAYSLHTQSIPAYYESQSLEDAWTALVDAMHTPIRGTLLVTYPEAGTGCKKWRPSWKQVMKKPLPRNIGIWLPNVERDDHDWCKEHRIERGFVRGLAVGGEEGISRCGELVVKDADGISHAFRIAASHQYPIPEDTYTLLGSLPINWRDEIRPAQYWAVGQRMTNKMFEKVSVFEIIDPNEIKRLDGLGLAAESGSILA